MKNVRRLSDGPVTISEQCGKCGLKVPKGSLEKGKCHCIKDGSRDCLPGEERFKSIFRKTQQSSHRAISLQ